MSGPTRSAKKPVLLSRALELDSVAAWPPRACSPQVSTCDGPPAFMNSQMTDFAFAAKWGVLGANGLYALFVSSISAASSPWESSSPARCERAEAVIPIATRSRVAKARRLLDCRSGEECS